MFSTQCKHKISDICCTKSNKCATMTPKSYFCALLAICHRRLSNSKLSLRPLTRFPRSRHFSRTPRQPSRTRRATCLPLSSASTRTAASIAPSRCSTRSHRRASRVSDPLQKPLKVPTCLTNNRLSSPRNKSTCVMLSMTMHRLLLPFASTCRNQQEAMIAL